MENENKFELLLTFEQLESLVNVLRKNGASGDDGIYMSELGRRGTYAVRVPSDACSSNQFERYHAYRDDTFYKCHDCRKCKHHDIEGDDVRCHLNDAYVPPICVGFANDDLVPSCSEYEEVTHE